MTVGLYLFVRRVTDAWLRILRMDDHIVNDPAIVMSEFRQRFVLAFPSCCRNAG